MQSTIESSTQTTTKTQSVKQATFSQTQLASNVEIPTSELETNALKLFNKKKGLLLHTKRKPDTTWQQVMGDVENQAGEQGYFKDTDCASISRDNALHVFGVTTNNQLFHTIRDRNGQWVSWDNLGQDIGGNYSFSKVSCAVNNNTVHVCAVTTNGKLLHAKRNSSGVWSNSFTDIGARAHNVGNFIDVGCDVINGHIHLVTITNFGKLLHIKDFFQESSFTDIEPLIKHNSNYYSVDCAAVGSQLHVCATTHDHQIRHTLRKSDESWQPFFGDIESQTGDHGKFMQVACAGIGDKLHVCGVNKDHQVLHTIRNADGGWQTFFGNIAEATDSLKHKYKYRTVSCSPLGNELHVCTTTILPN